MPELTPSALAALPESFIAFRSARPVPLPSRLAFNSALKNELGLHEQWFYDRTFPLWAAGKAGGLVFANQDSPSDNYLILGQVATPDGSFKELQLIGSSVAGNPDGETRARQCFQQPCSVVEILASEFCHQMDIAAGRILCIISDNSQALESNSTCTLATRVAQGYLSQGQLLAAATGGKQLARRLLDFVADHYYRLPEAEQPGGQDAEILAIICNTALKTAAKWQANGLYLGGLTSHDLYLSGETMGFQGAGFIAKVGDNFTLFNGQSIPYDNFTSQPDRVIEHCRQLLAAYQPHVTTPLTALADDLTHRYRRFFFTAMGQKLAIAKAAQLQAMVDELLALLARHRVDYFHCFNALVRDSSEELFALFDKDGNFKDWLQQYRQLKNEREGFTARAAAGEKLSPAAPLSHGEINRVLLALQAGNRNALEDFLENIQQGKAVLPNHWAA